MIRQALLIGALCCAIPAIAQERVPGKAVSISYVKFKPNMADRINEIESKYFDPAAEKIGTRPIVIRMASGEWDREYIFPMRGGMAELDFKTNKDNDAWMAEVDRLAGGAGMAKKLLAEWDAAVDHQKSEYGFSDQK